MGNQVQPVIGANTNVAKMMIGERTADFVRQGE